MHFIGGGRWVLWWQLRMAPLMIDFSLRCYANVCTIPSKPGIGHSYSGARLVNSSDVDGLPIYTI